MSYALLQVVRDVDKDLLGVQRGLGAIQGVVEQRKKKKKKRGPNKWMPFRRPEEAEPEDEVAVAEVAEDKGPNATEATEALSTRT